MKFCTYYQAQVSRRETSYFTALLRSFEHLTFDRTLDKERGLFEFFVPEGFEDVFCTIMQHFIDAGIVSEFKELPNRLCDHNAVL